MSCVGGRCLRPEQETGKFNGHQQKGKRHGRKQQPFRHIERPDVECATYVIAGSHFPTEPSDDQARKTAGQTSDRHHDAPDPSRYRGRHDFDRNMAAGADQPRRREQRRVIQTVLAQCQCVRRRLKTNIAEDNVDRDKNDDGGQNAACKAREPTEKPIVSTNQAVHVYGRSSGQPLRIMVTAIAVRGRNVRADHRNRYRRVRVGAAKLIHRLLPSSSPLAQVPVRRRACPARAIARPPPP